MRVLCAVESSLFSILKEGINIENLEFAAQWDQASLALLERDYECVFVSAHHWQQEPTAIWPIASQLRLQNIQGYFVDADTQAVQILANYYPEMVALRFQGDPANLFSQLQNRCPKLFSEHPPQRKLKLDPESYADFDEANNSQIRLSQNLGSNEDLAKRARSASANEADSALLAAPVSTKEHNQSLWQSPLSILHSPPPEPSSSLWAAPTSDIQEISDLFAILNQNAGHTHVPSGQTFVESPPWQSPTNNKWIIRHKFEDYLSGNLDRVLLPRLLVLMSRFSVTGVLNVTYEKQSLSLELYQGRLCQTVKDLQILSALSWPRGRFEFSPKAEINLQTTTLDLVAFVRQGILSHYPLNTLMLALSHHLQHFPIQSSLFSVSETMDPSMRWWEQCNGSNKLHDLINVAGQQIEAVCRDIYFAQISDAIAFSPTPFVGDLTILYDTPHTIEFIHDTEQNDPEKEQVRQKLLGIKELLEQGALHQVLGVERFCGAMELEKAYYQWIKQYHADRFAPLKNKEITRLSNELLVIMNTAFPSALKAEELAQKDIAPALHRPTSSPAATVLSKLSANLNNEATKIARVPSQAAVQSSNQYRPVTKQNGLLRPRSQPSASPGQTTLQTRRPHPEEENRLRTPSLSRLTPVAPPTQSVEKPSTSAKISELLAHNTDPNDQTLAPLPDEILNQPPQALLQLGRKKIELRQFDLAFAILQHASQLAPDNNEVLAMATWSEYLYKPHNVEAQIEKLQGLCSSAPGSKNPFWARYFLGKILFETERFEEATIHLGAAAKMNPQHTDAQRLSRLASARVEKQRELSKSFFAKWVDRIKPK